MILYLKNVGKIDPNIVQMVGESIINCEATDGTSGLGLVFAFEVFADSKYECVKLSPLEFEKFSIQERS